MTLLGSLTRVSARAAHSTVVGRGAATTANLIDRAAKSPIQRAIHLQASARWTRAIQPKGASAGAASTPARSYSSCTALRSASVSSSLKTVGTSDGASSDLARDQSSEVRALREQAGADMADQKFAEARQTLMKALDVQQAIFTKELSPSSFFVLVSILSDIVTCVRMAGMDPRDLSAIEAVLMVYEQQALSQFLAKSPAHAGALEHPAVYSFICSTAGCLIDAEAFTKAKDLLNKHLLFDLDTAVPSSTEGAYDLKDLRIASALNFRGIALFSDHSGCGGHGHGGHGHHQHAHDHKEAEVAWRRAKTFTESFVKLLQATKPVGRLDNTDALMLQACSIIYDNLGQVCLADGRLDEAVAFSQADLANVESAFPPYAPIVIGTQAQALKMLLETQKMDEAEVFTEKMLQAFPHPKPGVSQPVSLSAIPAEVTVQTAAIYDELSLVMHQFNNLDYSEKFLQISLAILQARLIDPETRLPYRVHPALARAENGLGLIQLQAKDYANAEAHLTEALRMKTELAKMGYTNQAEPGAQVDDGLAEFHHNLGLAQLGLNKLAEAEQSLLTARAKYHARYTDKDGKQNLVQATYAGLCSQLAQLYRMVGGGREEKALEMSNEALALKQQLFAPTSLQLVSDLYMSAHLTANTFQRFSAAVPLYRQLVSILERPVGSRPPEAAALGAALHWLANAYDRSEPREAAMAAETWRKAIVQIQKAMGPRQTLPLQENLIRVARELGRDAEVKEVEAAIADSKSALEAAEAEQKAKAAQADAQANGAASATKADEKEEGAPFTHA